MRIKRVGRPGFMIPRSQKQGPFGKLRAGSGGTRRGAGLETRPTAGLDAGATPLWCVRFVRFRTARFTFSAEP